MTWKGTSQGKYVWSVIKPLSGDACWTLCVCVIAGAVNNTYCWACVRFSHTRPALVAYNPLGQALTVWTEFFSMQNSCFRKNIYWKFLPRQIGLFSVSLQENTLFLPLLNLTKVLLKKTFFFLPHCFGICREGFCSRDIIVNPLFLPVILGSNWELTKKEQSLQTW